MFSKAKTNKSQGAGKAQKGSLNEGPAPIANASIQNSPRRSGSMRSTSVPSIISADVMMHGSINSPGEIQFDGQLEGDIKAGSLIIGEKASVKGEVVCETVTVRGKVDGGIRAKSVSLASTAQIRGDILHSSLSVETGAHFEGNCRHSDDPLAESAGSDFRRSRPAPAPSPKPVDTEKDAAAIDQTAAAASPTPSFLSQSRSPLR